MKKILLTFAALITLTSMAQAEENLLEFDAAGSADRPFVPFEMKDAEGHPVAGNAQVILSYDKGAESEETKTTAESFRADDFFVSTLPDQSAFEPIHMSAGEYVAKLNDAEQKLNASGQSLRDPGKEIISQQQKIDRPAIQETIEEAGEVYQQNLEKLQGQIASIDEKIEAIKNAAGESFEIKKIEKSETYLDKTGTWCSAETNPAWSAADEIKCFNPELGEEISFLQPAVTGECTADTPLGKTFLFNETWADGGGDSKFGWDASLSSIMSSDAAGIRLQENADLNITALKKYKVAHAKAEFLTGRSQESTYDLNANIFGSEVLKQKGSIGKGLFSSKNERGEERWIHEKDYPIASQTFMVGFVPVTLSLSSKIAYGPRYSIDVVPVKILGYAEYVGKATLIAMAGVGGDLKIFTVLIGVKGNLALINARAGVYPDAEFYLDDRNRPKITARMSGLAKLNTMSGNVELGVWAKSTFSVPQFKSSPPYVEAKPIKKEWKVKIGSYPGYDFPDATLFDMTVGYDICSGKKDIEVHTPNLPSPRAERENFATVEGRRILLLEEAFKGTVAEHLFDGKDQAKVQDIDRAINGLIQSREELNASARQVLAEAVN